MATEKLLFAKAKITFEVRDGQVVGYVPAQVIARAEAGREVEARNSPGAQGSGAIRTSTTTDRPSSSVDVIPGVRTPEGDNITKRSAPEGLLEGDSATKRPRKE